jgi:N-acetylglutamate synthase-like GNAT family acetyltransferase
MTSSSYAPTYALRRYQASNLTQVKKLFADNIREEWGSRYHDGKYIANAERYIESVVDKEDSDLNNIEEKYFEGGGAFWVLTCDDPKEETVVGTCGLQRLSPTTAEIRRMCIASNHRSKGRGSKMLQLSIQKARDEMNVEKLVVSTIEHSVDGIDFYKKRNGFVDTIDEQTGLPKKVGGVHGTPISEVFMEYEVKK